MVFRINLALVSLKISGLVCLVSVRALAADDGSSCDPLPSTPYTEPTFYSALESFEECTFRHRDALNAANKEAATLKLQFEATGKAVEASTAAHQADNNLEALKTAKQKEVADVEALKNQAQTIQLKYDVSFKLARTAQEQGDFLYGEAKKIDANAFAAVQKKHTEAMKRESDSMAKFKLNAIYPQILAFCQISVLIPIPFSSTRILRSP